MPCSRRGMWQMKRGFLGERRPRDWWGLKTVSLCTASARRHMRITFTQQIRNLYSAQSPVDTVSVTLFPLLADVLDRFQRPIVRSKVATNRPPKHLQHEREEGLREGCIPTTLGRLVSNKRMLCLHLEKLPRFRQNSNQLVPDQAGYVPM